LVKLNNGLAILEKYLSFEDHLCNLGKVFDRLSEAGLKLKPKKCQFSQEEISFLGHIVSLGFNFNPASDNLSNTFPRLQRWSSKDFPNTTMSSK
jgi:hypothetical protein